MFYRVIGLMSGSSLDGLDICYAELNENGGQWNYDIKAASCVPYEADWIKRLANASILSAQDYLLLDVKYGRYIAEKINIFIDENKLHHQVQLIASHGHTVFHNPENGITSQIGNGATIAALTEINVVSDLRIIDVALGGQGAPIVPIGEKLLLGNHSYFLNIGGIANITINTDDQFSAYDICPANRVLNLLANEKGFQYDDAGKIAATGTVNTDLFKQLNELKYYHLSAPKSLSNIFGTDIIYPLIKQSGINITDALATYVEHIAFQVKQSIIFSKKDINDNQTIMVSGGGAFNQFLIERLKYYLNPLSVDLVIPNDTLINFKEALIMGLIGVLRWREENNVLHSITGALRSSIGGALWIGQE